MINNFSSFELNFVENLLLAKGINYALPPKVLNRADYLLPFEMIYRDIKATDISSSDLDIKKSSFKEICK